MAGKIKLKQVQEGELKELTAKAQQHPAPPKTPRPPTTFKPLQPV